MQFTYQIVGIHCVSCVNKIQNILSDLYQIKSITSTPPRLILESNKKPSIIQLNKAISAAGPYSLLPFDEKKEVPQSLDNSPNTYYPLILIIGYIFFITWLNNFDFHTMNWSSWMNQFMAGFFLVFSAFKFLNLDGFATGYATYDLLARRWSIYGYIYPFLELSLGLLYLKEAFPLLTHISTIIIMGFSSLGVVNSLIKKQKIRCACLGTIINVPLSTITLIEDLGMVAMAALALIMG